MTSARFSLTRSVGGAVLLTVVCVNTLLLAAFGSLDYLSEKQRLEAELRYDLSAIADQLADNLAMPLWYLEKDHAARLIDGVMRNERIAAVVVTEHGNKGVAIGRTRDRAWNPSVATERPALSDVIGERREIRYENKPLGTLDLFATRRFVEEDLRQSLARIILRILGLNAALALVLAGVLRWRIIQPLSRLERYAARVSLGDDPGDPAELAGLRFELQSLGRTMRSTVKRLSAAQRNYRDIFENATEGIFQTTFDGRILSANAAMADILGYDSPQALMDGVVDVGRQLFHNPEERRDMLRRLVDEGSVAGLVVRFVRRDGQTIWVRLNIRLVRDATGTPLYTEGTMSDVTARLRAERRLEILNRHLREAVKERTGRLAEKAAELEAANTRLTELDRLKSGFLATVSHDLRTPLTSIMGFAKLIARDFNRFFAPFAQGSGPGDRLRRQAKRITDNLGIIESEGERLTRLINDFLDLSKIEAGRAEWRDANVVPAAIITRAADAVSADFEAKPEVAFSMDLTPDLPELWIDPDRLSQVLVNLLGNAAKFTDEGHVRLRAFRRDGMLRVEVADTGQGVPRESLEKIFDKFHQAQAGDTVEEGRRRKGTGLGLAICRQIVEHYNGRIWAESELGRGSTFIMELPLPVTADPAAPPEETS
ncbi:multi-sensor signal transduction histidine kinase [Solidesulfovibrio fructosivorans JJ]]|uniref:histidine kinase n=1 Tax=Solidesulfovibrio fructosivorans JJ] TaxID=596151 RepID=E1JYL1_SOLFR|nr:PAS domain-containing sensor histidine kinase [Solidesulfovibrio fructosivorans]EFL50595.1 multi-sensor signal transduction histidine kinase [Solidesulfovibrio fructosivorans JJ]]